MLNIINLLMKTKIIRTYNKQGQSVPVHKKNIPANKEWVNSLYVFNKTSVRFIPGIHNYVFKLLKAYFNMISENLQTKTISRKSRKVRRTSGRKIWISMPEIKHMNDSINITVYVYNRLYSLYKNKLDYLGLKWSPKLQAAKPNSTNNNDKSKKIIIKPTQVVTVKPAINGKVIATTINSTGSTLTKLHNEISQFNIISKTSLKRFSTLKIDKKWTTKGTSVVTNPNPVKAKTVVLTNKVKLLRREYPTYIGKSTDNSLNNYYVKIIKWLKLDKLVKIRQYKSIIKNIIKDKSLIDLKFLTAERYDYLINCFRKELMYLKFKQKLLFTEFKFNELYLSPLIQLLEIIYKKKVKFNIVILKNYYLNSSILLQIIVTKLKKESARGKPLKVVDKAYSGIRIPTLSSNKLQKLEKRFVSVQNVILSDLKMKKSDSLEQLLFTNNKQSTKDIHKLVLKNLESKSIAGLFIKISGRLTKRYKAQRAVSRLRFKGTLKNVHSAHKGLPSTLSRGYNNINVEKTMVHSKNRIGAYGLSGWIASY